MSSDQPQGFERFSPIHTFQNGGYPSPARSSSTGGLAGQSRPEGCLFCSTDLEGSPEVSSFPLEGHTSGICLSPVWSSSRTEIVHQNYEACRCLASPGGYSVDNLPGRSVVHACNTGGATGGHGHSPLPPRKPRVCDKPREVSVCSNTKTRISGVRYQNHRYDSSIARRQGEVDQISVQDFAGATTSLSTGPFSTDWQTYGINSGCFSCPLALSPPPTPQKSGSCEGKWLRFLFTPFTGSKGGNPVVASPPRSRNGRAILSSPPDLVIETDASKVGWGAVCQGVRTGGLWSQMEKKLHINCLELLAGSIAVKSFTKNRLCAHVRLRMDNTTAVAYVNRLGGTHSLVLSNLALALWEWAQKNNIMLSAEHYAGHLHTVADWERVTSGMPATGA